MNRHWGTIKHTNICTTGIPEKGKKVANRERKNGPNSPNLMKDLNLHIQEIQQIWNRNASTRSTHYSKIVKDKETTQVFREATHHTRGICRRIKSWFCHQKPQMPEGRGWHLKCWERKTVNQFYKWQNYPSGVKEKIRYSKINLRGFITSRPAPTRNSKESPSSENEETLGNNSKPCKEIKNMGNGNSQYYCTFGGFPVLLSNNWHAALYKFKVCSVMVWFTYNVKWFPQLVQLTSIFSYRYSKKKKFFLVMRTIRIYSNNFLIHHTAVLAVVILLCITPQYLFTL